MIIKYIFCLFTLCLFTLCLLTVVTGCDEEETLADKNPPRSKLRPSRNGRVSGKRFVEFGLLKIGF